MLHHAKRREEGVIHDDNDPEHRTTGCQQDVLLSPALIMLSPSLVVLMHGSSAQSGTRVYISYLSMLRWTGGKMGLNNCCRPRCWQKNTLEMSLACE